MDTQAHTPQPEAERPPAAIEQVFSVEEALDARGFQAFYDKARPDGNVFDNPRDTQKVFELFEAKSKAARRLEVSMNAMLSGKNKGRLSAEERKACQTHVENLATDDPQALLELQNDLNALESHPAEIARKEAEFLALREEHKPEKLLSAKAKLEAKRAELERINEEILATEYGLIDRALAFIGGGKKEEDKEKQKATKAQWVQITADINALEQRMTEAPQVVATAEAELRKIKGELASAQEKVFQDHDVAKKVHERLLKDNLVELTGALTSTDLAKRQKATKKLREESEGGYLSGEIEGIETSLDEGAYEKIMWEGGTTAEGKRIVGMKQLFEEGIKKVVESLPEDAGQSRVLRAYRTFMRMSGAEHGSVGFMDEAESKAFILETLEQAEEEAKTKHAGTGRRIYYQSLIRHLKHPGPITV